MPRSELRLGVDVGGTNTDAVVLDGDDRLVAKAKVPTTPDVSEGIDLAITAVLGSPSVTPDRITHVMLGTTHATNAILERRGLRRVAVVRLGAPATEAVPPLSTWPPDLRVAVSAGEVVVGGGFEFDGRPLAPLDEDAIARFVEPIAERVDAVAIVSVFAPVSPEHELRAADRVREVAGSNVDLSLSHEIGTVGLLERENATVLNATLGGVTRRVAEALSCALNAHGLEPLVFFAQNDGSLMGLDYALDHPVLTIGSGPANSIRGAAHLSGLDDGLVVDVGGTSTDIGAIANGFARESTAPFEIGGVRTNFRMPDLVSLRLGGGTVLRFPDRRPPTLGPDSVGYRISETAMVFGGCTATLTDAAAAAGRTVLGDPALTTPRRRQLGRALSQLDAILADGVDRIKTARTVCPVVAVGGGAFLVPDALPGVSDVLRPCNHDVANAIGAALAHVSGQAEAVVRFAAADRAASIDAVCAAARGRAVLAGADPTRIEIVEIEEIPLAYLTDPAVRIRAKAAGPLGEL